MTPTELQQKLSELMALPGETEWVEFKEAKNNLDFDDLGRYFSALSNEANLKGQECGWLILGVKDKPREIIGLIYRPNRPDLDSVKQEVAVHTTNRITFDEIYESTTAAGRVIMFQIPAALRGVPTAWKGHYYGRDEAKREDIDKLLLDKLSDALNSKQKRSRVGNLLFEMSHKDNTIKAFGPRKSAVWRLLDRTE